MTTQQYTLKEARSILGVSKKNLSALSGISMSAINAIEQGGDFKTNIGVAELLAAALGLEVREIDWPRGLSHLGRPPKTGKRIMKRTFTITICEEVEITDDTPVCSDCNLTIPLVGVCGNYH